MKQNVPLGLVGMAPLDQNLDHRDHLFDMLGGAGFDSGRCNAERSHVLVKDLRETGGDDLDRRTGFPGRSVDLVIEIRDVARIYHVRITPFQDPIEQIENHRRPCVTDVWKAVDRRAANIHGHAFGIAGNELFLAPRERVVDANAHGFD